MDAEAYLTFLTAMTNKEYEEQFLKMAQECRTNAIGCREIDATMTFILQGLALQMERLIDHAKKRKANLDKQEKIKKEAEPIEDDTDNDRSIL